MFSYMSIDCSDLVIPYLCLLFRFLSSYDSRFVIKEDLNRIQRCSVSTDETRVDYIMAAVESARRAFPNHVKRTENSTKPHSSTAAFGTENTVVAVNGQFESWMEEDVGEVKEVMDERVSVKKGCPFWAKSIPS